MILRPGDAGRRAGHRGPPSHDHAGLAAVPAGAAHRARRTSASSPSGSCRRTTVWVAEVDGAVVRLHRLRRRLDQPPLRPSRRARAGDRPAPAGQGAGGRPDAAGSGPSSRTPGPGASTRPAASRWSSSPTAPATRRRRPTSSTNGAPLTPKEACIRRPRRARNSGMSTARPFPPRLPGRHRRRRRWAPASALAAADPYAASPFRKITDADWKKAPAAGRLRGPAPRGHRAAGHQPAAARSTARGRSSASAATCRSSSRSGSSRAAPAGPASTAPSPARWPRRPTSRSACRAPSTTAPSAWATRATSSTTARGPPACATATTASR